MEKEDELSKNKQKSEELMEVKVLTEEKRKRVLEWRIGNWV